MGPRCYATCVFSWFVKGAYVVATLAALSLSVVAGYAVAAQPWGKAVIDDWYDNGEFDRTWDCECLRDAIDRLPEDIGAPYSPAREDFQRQLQLESCEGSEQVVETSSTTVEATGSPGSDAPGLFALEWRLRCFPRDLSA